MYNHIIQKLIKEQMYFSIISQKFSDWILKDVIDFFFLFSLQILLAALWPWD
jgi:hypothetical protein